jgi:Type IX secretion system protein PorV
MHRISVALLILVCAGQGATAGNRAGSVTAQFLKIPINARAAAIGNAQVSLAEGAAAIAFNPAGTLTVQNVSVTASYDQWWADITHSFFGIAANLQEWGTIGIGLTLLATDDMVVRTPGFPEGTGEMFRVSEYAYTFSYSRQISEEFGLGLSVKYIDSHLYNSDIKASSIAFDFGTLYDIPVLRTRLGISVNNLGRDLKYLNETYSLPTALRFGARTTLLDEGIHKAYAVVQIGRPNDADEQYNVGVEYTYQDMVSLRTGYRFNYDTEDWSGGVGISLSSLGVNGTLDYAYTHYKYLPGTHMFTTEIGF